MCPITLFFLRVFLNFSSFIHSISCCFLFSFLQDNLVLQYHRRVLADTVTPGSALLPHTKKSSFCWGLPLSSQTFHPDTFGCWMKLLSVQWKLLCSPDKCTVQEVGSGKTMNVQLSCEFEVAKCCFHTRWCWLVSFSSGWLRSATRIAVRWDGRRWCREVRLVCFGEHSDLVR